jgi:hypothetical protein
MLAAQRRPVVPATAPVTSVLPAFQQQRQRLDQRTLEPLGRVVTAMQAPHVTGDATPYVSIRIRAPRHDRPLVDGAYFDTAELCQVPLPSGEEALAHVLDEPMYLAVALRSLSRRCAPLEEAGLFTPADRLSLREELLRQLRWGATAADALAKTLPSELRIDLGEAGRRRGWPTLHALVLDELRREGTVVLRPSGRSLMTSEAPLWSLRARPVPPMTHEEASARLALRFFSIHGPTTLDDFAAFCRLSRPDILAAVGEAGLVRVRVGGEDRPIVAAPPLAEALQAFEPPAAPRLAFVPRRDPMSRGLPVPTGVHPVILGGRLGGFWAWDGDARELRYRMFEAMATRPRRAADAMARELADWLSTTFGARVFDDGDEDANNRLDAAMAMVSPRL